jgi:predicted enzyme related to lactoylglutathione lyase
MDIPTVGRIQVVCDPAGAPFALLRALSGDSTPSAGPGAFHWCELWTGDPKAAVAFYEQVLGVSCDEMPMPQGTYSILMTEAGPTGGVMASPMPGTPAMWTMFIEVDDCDAAIGRAQRLGEKVVSGPETMPEIGRFAVVTDNVGALIGLIKPAPRAAG